MPSTLRPVTLLLLLGGAIVALAISRTVFVHTEERPDAKVMRQAERLASHWFDVIETRKTGAGIPNEVMLSCPHAGMLGAEWSEFTTTLGSIEAKRTAANPRFAALMVRLFHDAGIDSTSCIGIVLSGSFPTLAVATLAAAQTVGVRTVVLSSLGSSSYGANQPGATWLDMESWLREDGQLRYGSRLVTMGAEGDSGGGLSDEGIALLRATAARHGVTLAAFPSFEHAVQAKESLLASEGIDLLVNIGGNQTSLGACRHASTLPTGLVMHPLKCTDPDRGLIERCSQRNIPVIHLLHIKSIAARHKVPLVPEGNGRVTNDEVLFATTVNRGPVVLLLVAIFVMLMLCRWQSPGARNRPGNRITNPLRSFTASAFEALQRGRRNCCPQRHEGFAMWSYGQHHCQFVGSSIT